MNVNAYLRSLFSDTAVESLGWMLLHSFWQFTAIAVLVAANLRLLRRSSAKVRYVTLVAALSISAVIPVVTCFWIAVPSAGTVIERTAFQNAQPVEDFNSTTKAQYEYDELQGVRPGSLRLDTTAKALPLETGANALRLAPSETSDGAPLQTYFPWIVSVWCVGVLACSLRPLLGWRMLRRLRRVGISTPSDELLTALDRVSHRMKIDRAVKLCCSTLATGPLLLGYFRPMILLPMSLVTRIPATQLEAILAHELAHVRRHDFMINLLQTLAETLFFYHPAIWWMSHRIRVEREYCCDDLVVKLFDNAAEYGRALISVEQSPGRSTSLALGAKDGSLLDRVQRIVGVNGRRPSRVIDRWPAVVLSLVSAFTVVVLAWNWSAVADETVSEKVVAKPVPAPLELRIVANPSGSSVEPQVPNDISKLHYPIILPDAKKPGKDSGFAWFPLADPKDETVSLPLETTSNKSRLGLLADTPEHALLWDGTWSVEECEAIPNPDLDGDFLISGRLDAAGGRKLRALTGAHIKQRLAIVANGKIISAPIVQAAIGDKFQIAGRFNKEEAAALVKAMLTVTPPVPQQEGTDQREQPEKADDERPSAVIDGKFRGHVTGPDGRPFAGAAIHFVSYADKAKTLGPVLTTTDANGDFEFKAPPLPSSLFDGSKLNREGLIFAIADGYAPDWMEMWSRKSLIFREYQTPRKGQQIELQLAKDDVPIKGQFLDAGGKPLVGARVQMTQLMVPGNGSLDAHLERWSKASDSARFLSKAPTYKRELTWMHVIPNLTTESVTDDEGRFTLKGIGRDRLARLKVMAPNVQTAYVEVMARNAPDVGMLVDFDGKPTMTTHGASFSRQLKRGLLVHGVVRDRDTKAPIEGMWAAKYYNPLTHPPAQEYSAVTDENGRFTLSGLDPVLMTLEEDKHREITAIPQPGVQYFRARGVCTRSPSADDDPSSPVVVNVVIECVRGIRYRLKLVDEAGQPVEGTVEYRPVYPNSVSKDLILSAMRDTNWLVMNRAARRADGSYEGFVLPGPGAITVKMPNHLNWRPAFADPKAFFEPETTNWLGAKERYYGTKGMLHLYGTNLEQTKYNAIVLVDPPKSSDPLELTATIYRTRPRQVTLLDPDGRPVTDVDALIKSSALTHKETHRAATFPLLRLHPDRVTQITFRQDDRQLVALLLARGDDDSPITVKMEPWGTVTGRVLDSDGKPIGKQRVIVRATDEGVDRYHFGDSNAAGRFEATGLIPGLTYRIQGKVNKPGFVAIDGGVLPPLTLKPGESLDLGDVRVKSER